jgi:hypothetical protein
MELKNLNFSIDKDNYFKKYEKIQFLIFIFKQIHYLEILN